MKRNVLKNVPVGVLFVASFYVFGAFILLIGGPTFIWTLQPDKQISFGNFLFSAMVTFYLLIVRRQFFGGGTVNHPR